MAKKWHQLEKLDHKALKKLQVDRDRLAKQAQDAVENKRRMIIGGVVLCFVVFVVAFMAMMSSRATELAKKAERSKLLFSKVVEFKGKVKCRNIGTWDKLTEKFDFDKSYSFKSESESSVTVKMQLDNQVKLSAESEMTVFPPKLAKDENKVEQETIKLKHGEVTVAVSLDGRGIIELETGGITVKGSSGLFKTIYDQAKDKGEVVVKNGLVEVTKKRNGGSPVKVSGFYKITFSAGKISSPTQASVIQYDWR